MWADARLHFSRVRQRSALATRARTTNRLPASAVGPNHLRIASRGLSVVSLILRGTANRRYVLERSIDLRTWTTIASTIAPLDGVARMKDTSPPSGQAFYRAVAE